VSLSTIPNASSCFDVPVFVLYSNGGRSPSPGENLHNQGLYCNIRVQQLTLRECIQMLRLYFYQIDFSSGTTLELLSRLCHELHVHVLVIVRYRRCVIIDLKAAYDAVSRHVHVHCTSTNLIDLGSHLCYYIQVRI